MRTGPDQAGFSLLELLVASSIFFTFMVGICTIYTRSHAIYMRGQTRIEVQQSARVALQSMAREIRTAGYDPSDVTPLLANASPVQIADAGTLAILADADGDRVTDLVTYRLQGNQIVRDVSSWDGSAFPVPTASQVVDGVDLTFSYFDGSSPINNPIPTPVLPEDLSAVRRITIDLVASQEAVGTQMSYPLTMDVSLRNP